MPDRPAPSRSPSPRKMPLFGRTGTRLILLFGIVLLPILTIDIREALNYRQTALENSLNGLERLTGNVSRQQSEILTTTRYVLDTLAKVDVIVNGDSAACSKLLARIVEGHQRYTIFFRLDDQGRVTASSAPDSQDANPADWPRELTGPLKAGKVMLSPRMTGPLSGRQVIIMTIPIGSDPERQTGVIGVGLKAEWLNRQLAAVSPPPGFWVLIFNDQGRVIAASGDDRPEESGSIADWPLFKDAMNHPGGRLTTTSGDGRGLLAYQASLTGIDGGYHIVAGVSQRQVLAGLRSMIAVRLGGLAAVLALGLFAAAWASRRLILDWLDGLAILAGRIAAGDLSARSGLSGGDSDMTLLANAFDLMAERIESREKDLRRSNELFNQIMDNVRQIFWIRDARTGKIVFVNKAYETIWGTPANELARNPAAFMAQVHPEDYAQVAGAMRRQASGELIDEEFRCLRGDDHVVWIHARTFPIRDESGEIIRFTGIAEDVTGRKQAELALVQSRAYARALLDGSPGGAVLLELDGAILDCNSMMAERFGLTPGEMLGRVIFDLFPPELAAERRRQVAKAALEGTVLKTQDRRGEMDLYNVIYPIPDQTGTVTRLAVFSMDISDLKRTEEKLRLLAGVFANSNEAIMITDARGNIVEVNQAFTDITGFARDEAVGSKPSILKSGRHDAAFYKDMWSSIYKNGQWSGEVWDRKKDGEIYPKWLSISAVRDDNGTITHFVAIFTDISSIKQTEERLQQLAHFDHLTGLPNRVLFRDRLRQALYRADRHGDKVGLMFLDLDRFKNINDTLGHKAGDLLLVETARRLAGCVRGADTVSRLGGDEFTVVVTEVENAGDVADVADKILRVFLTPFMLEGREVFITPSVGITLYPDDAANPDELIKNADAAMYQAKEQGRNNFQFYSRELHARASERLVLETDLRNAITRKEFVIHYQPRVQAGTHAIVGAEALVRWQHPKRGLIPPDRFIPLAEETGLIADIGRQVLDEVTRFRDDCILSLEASRLFTLAVNISSHQFRRPDLIEQLSHVINDCGLAGCLEIELTESALMTDVEAARSILDRIKALGIRVSIDDFGTGYSSLSYLKRFPIDILKIDRSFVRDLPEDNDSAMIAKAVLALGHSLNMKVLAEGVETKAQADFLTEAGCDEFQGFLFYKPMPGEEFLKLLRPGT